ncbi:hypothetical protein [Lignipirellula cremea]|uniref:Uncharacterized protein n=1 Tax=Lignipirellula cremea TaxID=2528010 RepID=A0A518E0Y1_9BACT|nr:hypothetical protein [Lignipirellula cremea]QDU97724.1 hypothetical protein Pla8534_55780 [Lignipirellula cremea]
MNVRCQKCGQPAPLNFPLCDPCSRANTIWHCAHCGVQAIYPVGDVCPALCCLCEMGDRFDRLAASEQERLLALARAGHSINLVIAARAIMGLTIGEGKMLVAVLQDRLA